jgi:hypothetical protein
VRPASACGWRTSKFPERGVAGDPALGGQAIGSIIGTIIGLYSHGPNPYQLTHAIADEIIAELGQIGALLDHQELYDRLAQQGKKYGLVRQDGFLFSFPGKGFALANITHIKTPLDPLQAANTVFAGRRQADNVVQFLKEEYPDIFGNVRIRAYGNPGLRQTRWIVGRHHLTLDEIRSGIRLDDAVVRCAWSVELHDKASSVHWEGFEADHLHYIPLRSMVPQDADNIVAAGRCVDADPYALSSVRVMGPCIAWELPLPIALILPRQSGPSD